MKKLTCDILFWASIQPNKHGSFEDYICHLARACSKHDLEIVFVLGDKITESVKNLFCEYHVNYLSLSERVLNSIYGVLKVLKTYKPKLVHLHFISHCSPIIPACRLMGVKKLLYTDHSSRTNDETKCGFLSCLKWLRRRFYAGMINRYIVVSDFVGDHIHRNCGVPRAKITTIHNGVNTDRFSVVDSFEKAELKQQLFNVTNSTFVVTFAGQLIKAKGIDIFLDAAQKLLARQKGIVFIIAGETKGAEIMLDAYQQRWKDNIRFVGRRDDMEQILNASDILVCPSIWQEAFGLVLIEAMACGVTVVATKVGGIPEVVLHRETGLLVNLGDSSEIVSDVEELILEPRIRGQFKKFGRRRVEMHFGLEKMVINTILVYREKLAELI